MEPTSVRFSRVIAMLASGGRPGCDAWAAFCAGALGRAARPRALSARGGAVASAARAASSGRGLADALAGHAAAGLSVRASSVALPGPSSPGLPLLMRMLSSSSAASTPAAGEALVPAAAPWLRQLPWSLASTTSRAPALRLRRAGRAPFGLSPSRGSSGFRSAPRGEAGDVLRAGGASSGPGGLGGGAPATSPPGLVDDRPHVGGGPPAVFYGTSRVARIETAGKGPAGSASGGSPPGSPRDPAARASECDEALTDLVETRRRVRMARRPPPGQMSVRERAAKLVSAARAGVASLLRLALSVPGATARWAALPLAEKKASLASMWSSVAAELRHYWVGTKLLGTEIKIASRLGVKVLRGSTLTRRERKQLTRTVADMFRLVPMLVFVVVPFMELLLPVALKVFPNMLPSTFEDKVKKEEEMKRSITARLEIARFLQDTMLEMADDVAGRSSSDGTRASAEDLYRFIERVRSDEPVSTDELLKFAKLFNDELTLDNLSRDQLVSLCRFVGISPFGTDSFLRSRLRHHLREIKEDDREIRAEGIDELSPDELRAACRARGMRAPYGDGADPWMRAQLADWLDWSLNRSLPSSLLLLSRTFTVTAPINVRMRTASVDETTLRETLSTLPDEAVEDVELFETAPDAPDKAESNRRRLEMLEREEEMIREEQHDAAVAQAAAQAQAKAAEAAQAAEAARAKAAAAALAAGAEAKPLHAAAPAEAAAAARASAAAAIAQAPQVGAARAEAGGEAEAPAASASLLPTPTAITAAVAAAAVVQEAAAAARVAELEGVSEEEKALRAAEAKQARLRAVSRALAALASSSGVAVERDVFMGLVTREVDRLENSLDERGTLTFSKRGLERHVSSGATDAARARLSDRLLGLLERVEKDLDDADAHIGSTLHVLDVDGDGVISREELTHAMGLLSKQVGKEELRQLLEMLAKAQDAEGAPEGLDHIDVHTLMELAAKGTQDANAKDSTAKDATSKTAKDA